MRGFSNICNKIYKHLRIPTQQTTKSFQERLRCGIVEIRSIFTVEHQRIEQHALQSVLKTSSQEARLAATVIW